MSFDSLDKVPILHILQHCNIYDLLTLKSVSKRLYALVKTYLSNRYYKTEYLNKCSNYVESELTRLEALKLKLFQLKSNIDTYRRHVNRKPHAHFITRHASDRGSTYMSAQWKHGNIETILNSSYDLTTIVILVRKVPDYRKHGEVYEYITQCCAGKGLKRVFPRFVVKSPDVLMAFSMSKSLEPYHPCKICKKDDHTIHNCPKAKCGVCHKSGHISRVCKEAYCTKCKSKGKHITSRCPRNVCFKCGFTGHLQKHCTSKRHIK